MTESDAAAADCSIRLENIVCFLDIPGSSSVPLLSQELLNCQQHSYLIPLDHLTMSSINSNNTISATVRSPLWLVALHFRLTEIV
jgi:hypothetical protein